MARLPRNSRTTFDRRNARARSEGWSSYGQKRYWEHKMQDDAYVIELGEQVGGPVETERQGSLFSHETNRIVNPRGGSRIPSSWQVRLLRAAGKL